MGLEKKFGIFPNMQQQNVERRRGGIEVPLRRRANSTGILLSKGYKCAACQIRMQVSKNNTEKKKPKVRKRKRNADLKYSVENVCSDEALSKENMDQLPRFSNA